MTPKQIQRIEKKIADIKRILATEKRKFGGYDDSRGLRYLPTQYYLQLGNYKGGLAYTRWFDKAFPDDMGFPDFLFEWTVLLFKTGKLKEARAKAWQTYCANTYVLDSFLGRPFAELQQYEWSNMAGVSFLPYFPYRFEQAGLHDFSQWLEELMDGELFQACSSRYLSLYQRLATEQDRETRGYLRNEAHQLMGQFTG